MKWATILTLLAGSTLSLGPKFEVTNLSSDSPVSFIGVAKTMNTGSVCTVSMHNNSTEHLLAVEVSGEVTDPEGQMLSVGLNYDGFFKEAGIPPGADFEFVDSDSFPSQGRSVVNGVEIKPEPKKGLVCLAKFKVQFVQFEDGSTFGDDKIHEDAKARRTKRMALLSHLVEVYDAGGEAAFEAALGEPDMRNWAYRMKIEAEYFKSSLIDLFRKRLAAAQNRRNSGIL